MRYPFSVVVQIPNGMYAHISILRLSILESVLTATSAAFGCQAANVGQLMLCGIHSACPVLSGGGKCWQTIAVRPFLPFRALFGKEKPGQCERAVCDGNWDERNVIERKSLGHDKPRTVF